MAKSSRSSSKKQNNRRKADTVFGPAELARDERLSAKLLELAQQPKPEPSRELKIEANNDDANDAEAKVDDNVMDVDSQDLSESLKGRKKRVEKRKKKMSSIVFKKHSDRLAAKKKSKQSKSSQ